MNISENVCAPMRSMYDLNFYSQLSLVTVGFLVRNGFGVSYKACHIEI